MSGSDDDENGRESDNKQYRWHQARPTVQSVFERLGYDLWNQSDINRLRENLEFSQKARLREEAYKSRRLGWTISVGIAILSAIVTTMGEWLVNKFGK